MPRLDLRERSASEIIDGAFQLYRQNPLPYILAAAISNAPVLLFQLILQPTRNVQPGFLTSWTFIALSLMGWLTFSIMSAVLNRFASDVYLDRNPDLRTALRETLPRLPAVLVATLMKGVTLLLGFVVLIFGVLYPLARFFAVTQAVVLEGKGPIEAFGRSSELSRDRKGHILATLGLTFLVYFVLSIGVSGIAAMTGSQTISLIISSVFTIIAYPLIAITETLLYYDARIRAEGFDIEMMAMADTPAATLAT
jgi:hypothetical protein